MINTVVEAFDFLVAVMPGSSPQLSGCWKIHADVDLGRGSVDLDLRIADVLSAISNFLSANSKFSGLLMIKPRA